MALIQNLFLVAGVVGVWVDLVLSCINLAIYVITTVNNLKNHVQVRGADLKRRLKELLNLLLPNAADLDIAPIHLRNLREEIPIFAFRFQNGRLFCHIDRFEIREGFILHGANIHAERTTCA